MTFWNYSVLKVSSIPILLCIGYKNYKATPTEPIFIPFAQECVYKTKTFKQNSAMQNDPYHLFKAINLETESFDQYIQKHCSCDEM